MRPKIDPCLEAPINLGRTGLAKAMDSKPSLVIDGGFNALQPCNLEFVEVRIGLAGEVERDLVIKREQFVRVPQQISQSILCRSKPLHHPLLARAGVSAFTLSALSVCPTDAQSPH